MTDIIILTHIDTYIYFLCFIVVLLLSQIGHLFIDPILDNENCHCREYNIVGLLDSILV